MTHAPFRPLLSTKAGHSRHDETVRSLPQSSQVKTCSSPSSDEAEKSKESSMISEMFDMFPEAMKLLLKGLRTAAQFSPVPCLAEAAGLTVDIFEGLEQAHVNRNDSQALSRECVFLVSTIDSTCMELAQDDHLLPSDLTNHLRLLCKTLKTIKEFASKQAGRSFFKRLLTKSNDAEAIRRHREEMNSALGLFSLQSHIATRQMCTRILAELSKETAAMKVTTDAASNPSRVINDSSSVSFFKNTSYLTASGACINNVAGDQRCVSNSNHSNITNSGNNYDRFTRNADIEEKGIIGYGPFK
ncbi:hypothetical protein K435DRAFT_863067 [Dendrothele bispora CBS 962.96]|uniref:Uncharacterized protein n=1 Tax=Dendrothele bispora (strain CBS 962.96) TaxID=1314807 RepID=A0A4V4HEP7_DENBC|nr:hypothetical protein K435DRAFT_863067 [Dendrothele bispora CBS 962.96]